MISIDSPAPATTTRPSRPRIAPYLSLLRLDQPELPVRLPVLTASMSPKSGDRRICPVLYYIHAESCRGNGAATPSSHLFTRPGPAEAGLRLISWELRPRCRTARHSGVL